MPFCLSNRQTVFSMEDSVSNHFKVFGRLVPKVNVFSQNGKTFLTVGKKFLYFRIIASLYFFSLASFQKITCLNQQLDTVSDFTKTLSVSHILNLVRFPYLYIQPNTES